jgi:hypothetical protein
MLQNPDVVSGALGAADRTAVDVGLWDIAPIAIRGMARGARYLVRPAWNGGALTTREGTAL